MSAGARHALRIAHDLGGDPVRAELLGSAVNQVWRVFGGQVDWVVRFPVDLRRPDEFQTERWAFRAAADAGIPTAEVVDTGIEHGRPFMVLRYVRPAVVRPADPWRWLGAYARRVARIPLGHAPEGIYSRFGTDLPSAWRDHLRYNLDALDEDPLLADGAYRASDQPVLRAMISELTGLRCRFGLAHGDLAPRNLVSQGPTEAPVLLDWGTATTGPAPWTDLQQVYQWARHDRVVTEGELAAFADAAGQPIDPACRRILNSLTALRYLDLARWARDRRPDLYEEYRLACWSGTRKAVREATRTP